MISPYEMPRQPFTWEPWLQRYIRLGGRVFLDIGANEGQWSKPLSGYYERVEAFEPHPGAIEVLKAGLPVNVRVHEVALWSEAGELEMATYAHSSHTSAIFRDQGINTGPQTGAMTATCRTLDESRFQGVDFVKIDTEGAEVEIIKGGITTLAGNMPDLLVEIHNLENRAWLEDNIPKLGYTYELQHHPNYARDDPYYEAHLWMRAYPEEP